MSVGDFTFAMLTEYEKKLPFYLMGAGYNFHQELDPHTRPMGYPDYQWIQVKSGKGIFTIQGKSYEIGENQGILLFPDLPHEYHALESPWIVNWFTFNGENIDKYLMQIHIEKSGIYSVINPGIFLSKIKRALDLLRSTNPIKVIEASLLVHEFLISFIKYTYKDSENTVLSLHYRLNPVIKYIENNFAEVIEIEDLSEVISVTPQYLCKLFKKIVKQRPIEYLNNVRINKSKELLLRNPKMKIEEITIKSGYKSPSYFCSKFQEIEGMTPREFRGLYPQRKASGSTSESI